MQKLISFGEPSIHIKKEGKGMFFTYRSIQSVGPLKELYTSSPGRPVHSDTNSASPWSILAMQQLCAKNIHSHFHYCLYPGTQLYSWLNWGVMERSKMLKLRNGSNSAAISRSLVNMWQLTEKNIFISHSFMLKKDVQRFECMHFNPSIQIGFSYLTLLQ